MKPAPQALLPCLVVIAVAGCSSGKAPSAAAPPKVGTVTAEQQTVPLTRDLVGRLSAYFSANVVARVSGVLVKRTYKEGDEVREGQLLFEIDPSYYTAVLNNNLAILAEDQATYINNRVTAERDHKLLPVGSVSQQTVDDADAAERSAAAKVQADQAAVATARINLGYTRVTSPISGTASQQQVTQGALVGSATSDAGSGGTLLTTVAANRPALCEFHHQRCRPVELCARRRTSRLRTRATPKYRSPSPTAAVMNESGALDFSDVVANPATGAVNLRALVPNPKHELLPGMYVTLTDHSRRAEPRVPDPTASGATRHGRRLCVGGRAGRQGATQECNHRRELRQRLDRHRRPRERRPGDRRGPAGCARGRPGQGGSLAVAATHGESTRSWRATRKP